MMTTFFRVQPGDYDPTALLDPECQTSDAWHRDDLTRSGVSVCADHETLAHYLATTGSGIPYGDDGWVLVELTGTQSEDTPLDAEDGEQLVHPTEIVSVQLIPDELFEMISNAFDDQ